MAAVHNWWPFHRAAHRLRLHMAWHQTGWLPRLLMARSLRAFVCVQESSKDVSVQAGPGAVSVEAAPITKEQVRAGYTLCAVMYCTHGSR
jgi:hypothetical protein